MLETIALLPLLIATTVNNPIPEGLETGFTVKNEENVQIIVPYNHQIEDLNEKNAYLAGGTACGPTTITMLLRHNGMETNVNEVIEILPTNVYIKGVGFYALEKGANLFNMRSVEVGYTPTDIYNALYEGNPVIMNIQNYDGLYGHAIVVTGIRGYNGDTAESLVVHDPFDGPYKRFEYVNSRTLKQPSGYYNPIGHKKPFYITR